MAASDDSSGFRTAARFPPTRWSLVVSARDGEDTGGSSRALEDLCQSYWKPVYAYIRRRGNSPADAEDLTQGFFAKLLALNSLDGVDASKGRLRTFLLTAVSRHMASEYQRESALKRGGGKPVLPLDCGLAEEGFVRDPGHQVTPDLEFERQWALGLLADALAATREQEANAGRLALFEELKGLISLEATTDQFKAIGERLGMSEGAVKVAAHRLRGRYRDQLRTLVADTVADKSEIQDELRHLFEVFQQPG